MLPVLRHDFADAVPELALPWQAAPVADPRLLHLDEELAVELGLDPEWPRTPEGLQLLVGGLVPDGARAVAQCYAGHQFGGFSPRLGDGRALLLGELEGPDGRLHDLHLKGSGRTPFSRGGDGLAAVGPMLRELVVSRAMHALGIPTTRALAVVATGAVVQREEPLPGALLVRVASSHLRVGTFEYAASTGDADLLRRLAAHAAARHLPGASPIELYDAVVAKQAALLAQWVLVGFVHGVMNTDNTTISGETIDYGPCAFLDGYDPAAVFSSIDTGGRYAFARQPPIMEWNLARLAEAMLPLFSPDTDEAVDLANTALSRFRVAYQSAWTDGMRAKLGLAEADPGLVEHLLGLLARERVDLTSTFRHLATAARGDTEPARSRFLDLAGIDAWLARWLAHSPDADAMDRVNPVYVPRNQPLDEALTSATAGDLAPVEELLDAVSRPFEERPGLERFAEPAPAAFAAGFQTFCGT